MTGARPGRTRSARLAEGTERARPLFQHGLSAKNKVKFLADLLGIDELAGDDAVDPRPHFREAIFVSDLQVGLARDQSGDDLIVKGKIGRGDD